MKYQSFLCFLSFFFVFSFFNFFIFLFLSIKLFPPHHHIKSVIITPCHHNQMIYICLTIYHLIISFFKLWWWLKFPLLHHQFLERDNIGYDQPPQLGTLTILKHIIIHTHSCSYLLQWACRGIN